MRIGVYLPNWVGDAVMAQPFTVKISANGANQITVIGRDWVTAIYRELEYIDQIIPFSATELNDLAAHRRLARRIRELELDEIYLLTDSLRSAFIARLAAIPVRVGYRAQWRRLLLTAPQDPPDDTLHRSLRYLNLLTGDFAAGDNRHLPQPQLRPSANENDWASQELLRLNCSRPLAICPASVASSRTAPSQIWVKIISHILASERQVLLLGSPAENNYCQTIADQFAGQPVYSLAGKYNLRQTMALLAACQGAIATDSGLGHIAAGLGRPTLSLFGAGDPLQTRPLGKNTRVLTAGVHCSPCRKNHCPNSEQPLLCWHELETGQVLSQFEELLRETGE